MVVIIDYGMGNIHSLRGALAHLDVDCSVSADAECIGQASRIILPGVGSFRTAMENLRERGLIATLDRAVEQGTPILGICLGMQLLTKGSTEDGVTEGLGYVDGRVDRFVLDNNALRRRIKIPHVGFNNLNVVTGGRLLSGLGEAPDFYFTHSYRLLCDSDDCVTSFAENGERFVASFESGLIFGTQFHPELSQRNGIELLRNFIAC